MKLLDRYIFRTFMVPLGYCLAAFCLIYIIFDLTDNMPDFLESKAALLDVVRFYLILLPSVLIYIVPVSLMLATLYSLAQLTRHNEITAMRASGVSLYRLVMPFVTTGIIASLSVMIIHEYLGSIAAFRSREFFTVVTKPDEPGVLIRHNIGHKNYTDHRDWYIGQFHSQEYFLRKVTVTQQRTNRTIQTKFNADTGQWLDGRWWFTDVEIQRYNERGDPVGLPAFSARREMIEFNETPEDFLNEIKDPEELAAHEIHGYIRSHRLSDQTEARLMVDFHHRLAMPWACLIVTMIGIPFGAQTARRGAFLGVALTLGLFFAYYALMNVALAMGKKMTIDPLLAGWLPNLVFFAVGAVMIYRMR